MGNKIILPRRSVWMALAGVIVVFGTVALIVFDVFGYRSLGIFGLVPIAVGALLAREYFRD